MLDSFSSFIIRLPLLVLVFIYFIEFEILGYEIWNHEVCYPVHEEKHRTVGEINNSRREIVVKKFERENARNGPCLEKDGYITRFCRSSIGSENK